MHRDGQPENEITPKWTAVKCNSSWSQEDESQRLFLSHFHEINFLFCFNGISWCPLQWLSWNVVQILMVNFKTEDELQRCWRLSSWSDPEVCGKEWNVPTTWLAMKFGTDIHDHITLKCCECGDFMTFHLAPPSHQVFFYYIYFGLQPNISAK